LGRSGLRPYIRQFAWTIGDVKRKRPGCDPALFESCSKLGISGGRRRDCRLHRGSRRHLRRRVSYRLHRRRGSHHHRRRCCAVRCRPSYGWGRGRSCELVVSRSESVRSRNVATGNSNAGSSRSVIEIRSNGRCRFRSRDQIERTCCHVRLRHHFRSCPHWNRPREDDPCGRACRCSRRRCCSGSNCRSLAARYRGRMSCLAPPRCGRRLLRGWSPRDCWSIADDFERAAFDASCCSHPVVFERCGSRRCC
jgi:hypothetical protein